MSWTSIEHDRWRKIEGRQCLDAYITVYKSRHCTLLDHVYDSESLGRDITEMLEIPTIGIGAGVHCDGQVLVMHDLLGLSDGSPSFVKQFANLGADATRAARSFADEVADGKFPDAKHSYK